MKTISNSWAFVLSFPLSYLQFIAEFDDDDEIDIFEAITFAGDF